MVFEHGVEYDRCLLMKTRRASRAQILNTARSVWIAMSVSHCVLPQIRREGDGATANDQPMVEDVPLVPMDQLSVDVPTGDQGVDVPMIDTVTADQSNDVVCRPNETACRGTCANLQMDRNNCGVCGRICTAPVNATPNCNNMTCAYDCDPGYRVSGGSCAADCTSPQQNCSPSYGCTGTEGCASIRVMQVQWEQLAALSPSGRECNVVRATADTAGVWQDCLGAASRYCQQPAISAHFGIGPLSWTNAGVEIACVFSPAVNIMNQPAAVFAACVQDGSDLCVSTTNGICAAMAMGTRGWQPYSRDRMGVSAGCFGSSLVAETAIVSAEFGAVLNRPTCNPNMPGAFTSVGCMLAAHSACRAKRYYTGVGPIRITGAPNQWIFYCLRQKP